MRELDAPDESWRRVANGYADLYEGIVDRIVSGRYPDNEQVKVTGDELFAMRENLRREYRNRARPGASSGADEK